MKCLVWEARMLWVVFFPPCLRGWFELVRFGYWGYVYITHNLIHNQQGYPTWLLFPTLLRLQHQTTLDFPSAASTYSPFPRGQNSMWEATALSAGAVGRACGQGAEDEARCPCAWRSQGAPAWCMTQGASVSRCPCSVWPLLVQAVKHAAIGHLEVGEPCPVESIRRLRAIQTGKVQRPGSAYREWWEVGAPKDNRENLKMPGGS